MTRSAWVQRGAHLLGTAFFVIVSQIYSGAKDGRLSFDIPGQPIASALNAYAAVTGIEMFYDSDLAQTRRSTEVKGVLAPDVALRILLEGTGLTEIKAGSALAVIAVPRQSQYGGARLAEFGPYYNSLQDMMALAFCRHAETRPGGFRAVLRFAIGSTGQLQDVRLLSSTGELRRDSMISDELRGMSVDPPPAGLPQPVTMIVVPRSPERITDCDPNPARQAGQARVNRP